MLHFWVEDYNLSMQYIKIFIVSLIFLEILILTKRKLNWNLLDLTFFSNLQHKRGFYLEPEQSNVWQDFYMMSANSNGYVLF